MYWPFSLRFVYGVYRGRWRRSGIRFEWWHHGQEWLWERASLE
jgi:hypothetical protein